MYCHHSPDTRPDNYAAAFLVARAAGTAVTRNRIRRWLREDLRLLQMTNPRSGDFVVRFFGSAQDTDHNGLGRTLNQLYSQIGQDVIQ